MFRIWELVWQNEWESCTEEIRGQNMTDIVQTTHALRTHCHQSSPHTSSWTNVSWPHETSKYFFNKKIHLKILFLFLIQPFMKINFTECRRTVHNFKMSFKNCTQTFSKRNIFLGATGKLDGRLTDDTKVKIVISQGIVYSVFPYSTTIHKKLEIHTTRSAMSSLWQLVTIRYNYKG